MWPVRSFPAYETPVTTALCKGVLCSQFCKILYIKLCDGMSFPNLLVKALGSCRGPRTDVQRPLAAAPVVSNEYLTVTSGGVSLAQ